MLVGALCSACVLLTAWQKKQTKDVPTLLLINLAVIDLLLCCGGIPLTVTALVQFPRNATIVCCLHDAVTSSLRNASLVTLLFISSYRYQSVTHPFRAQVNVRTARKVLLVSWIFTFLFALIPFIEFQLRDNISLTEKPCARLFGNYSSDVLFFRLYYLPAFISVCVVLLPLYYKISRAALFRLQLQSIANASMVMAPIVLQIRVDKERDLPTRQKKRKSLKLTGAIICSVCVLWLPYTSLSFAAYFLKPSSTLIPTLEFVFLMLGYFNCTLNPILYAFTKRKFRNAFVSLLPCTKYAVENEREARWRYLQQVSKRQWKKQQLCCPALARLCHTSVDATQLTLGENPFSRHVKNKWVSRDLIGSSISEYQVISPPGGFPRKKMSCETHFIRK